MWNAEIMLRFFQPTAATLSFTAGNMALNRTSSSRPAKAPKSLTRSRPKPTEMAAKENPRKPIRSTCCKRGANHFNLFDVDFNTWPIAALVIFEEAETCDDSYYFRLRSGFGNEHASWRERHNSDSMLNDGSFFIPNGASILGFLNGGTTASPDWTATANIGQPSVDGPTSNSSVPEPSSLLLLGTGLLRVALSIRHKQCIL